MSSIQLESDINSPYYGDIKVTGNEITLTEGLEAIRQHLQIRFQIFLGEWFLDTTVGVPWYEDILKKQPTFNVVNEVLKNVILETPGVIELLEFTFEYDGPTREASIDFRAITTNGIIDFSTIEIIA